MSIYGNLSISDPNQFDPDMISIRRYYPTATLERDGVLIDFENTPMVIMFPKEDPLCVRIGGTDESPEYGFRNDLNLTLKDPSTLILTGVNNLENLPEIIRSGSFLENENKMSVTLGPVNSNQLKYIPDFQYHVFEMECPDVISLSAFPRHIRSLCLKTPSIQDLDGCPDVEFLMLFESNKLKTLAGIPSSMKRLSLKGQKHYNDLLCTMTNAPALIMIESSEFITKETINTIRQKNIGHDVIIEILKDYQLNRIPKEVLERGGSYTTADGHSLRVLIHC